MQGAFRVQFVGVNRGPLWVLPNWWLHLASVSRICPGMPSLDLTVPASGYCRTWGKGQSNSAITGA